MLTIYCVYMGDKYPLQYVYNLRTMVSRHCFVPYKFKCITDRAHIPLVDTLPAKPGLPGWWQKLALFEYANGPSIYFDLDSLIVSNIEPLLPFTENTLSMSRNWPQSGHAGWLSGMLAWDGKTRAPMERFIHGDIDRFWGDQEFLSATFDDEISEIPFGLMCSYKYHARDNGGPLQNTICVAFHGSPDYHEVTDRWVLEALDRVKAHA